MRTRTRNWTIFWVVLVVLAAGAFVVLSGLLDPEYETSSVDTATGVSDEQVIARGKYLAKAGDCTACHTTKEGAPFAGGVPLDTPFGTIYGTNITPDKEHGIGSWTSADFYSVMHDGIAPNHPLYPAMPYTSFRAMTREDSDALYAYLQSVRPVAVANVESDIPFPFNMRFLMRGWNLLFLRSPLPDASEGDSDAWVRGRYLANPLGHCTECHTPRGALGQLVLDETLEGGALGSINAPDITPEGLAARGWTEPALRQFLALGISPHSTAYGEMFEAFHNSTQYLKKEDNKALVVYLSGDKPLAPAPLPEVRDDASGASMTTGSGRSLYVAMCAGCHGVQGQGKPNVVVALHGNSTVRNADPHNLLHVILAGIQAKSFPDNQGRQEMPGFADVLSDQQVADLANYLRSAWGGQKADVQPAAVAASRGEAAPG